MARAVPKFIFVDKEFSVIHALKITTQVVTFFIQTMAILLAVGFMAIVPWILN